MLKQLVMALMLVAFFGAFALAQEKPETEIKEKQECSKSCCANKEMHRDMKMDENMHGMKHNMKSDSMDHNSMVREGKIDLKAIDENGDGKVYQDQMCWNVLSDSEGECPLCGMKLKEVSLDKAKENLKKHNHKVKE